MLSNYYKILGLSEDATVTEIKKAYRRKVFLYHPDVSEFENSQDEFIKINEAYRGLLNYKLGKKRKNYISHEEWIKTRRERARHEAARHAKIKYDEFKKSKLYKTAKTISGILFYFYILLGILMIASPVVSLIMRGINPRSPGTSIAGIVIIIFIGVVFVVVLFSARKSFKY